MLKAPHMLLIGAAGRNTGKTEFACTLLRRFSTLQSITAIKITVIRSDESRGSCPRGGSGCGVCSSLEGEYDITEETDRDGSKDTSRLLRAGANHVFWLRVLDTHPETHIPSKDGAKVHRKNMMTVMLPYPILTEEPGQASYSLMETDNIVWVS